MTRMRTLVAGSTALALGFAWPSAAADPAATVIRANGPADVRLAGAWRDASAGDRLASGDAARTGRQAYATLRDARGTVTELFPLTLFEVPEDNVFRTLSGTIWTHFKKIPGLAREIRTPAAVALIRGTTLAVTASPTTTRVTVLEGLVEVRDLAGKAGYVPEGYTVRADRDGLGPVERALAADLDEGRRFLDRTRGLFEQAPSGAATLPGLLAPGSPRRPSALERSEAAFDRDRAPAGGREPGPERPEPRAHSPEARPDAAAGARVDVQSRPGIGAEIRVETGRAADAPARAEPGARVDVAPGRVEADVKAEIGIGGGSPGTGAPEADHKDQRPIDIDVRARTDVRTDILNK